MSDPRSAATVLNCEFLEVRARLLEAAAALDRIDRAPGSVADDLRMKRIHQALRVLAEPTTDRAEQLQLLFSLDYDDAWREKFAAAEGASD